MSLPFQYFSIFLSLGYRSREELTASSRELTASSLSLANENIGKAKLFSYMGTWRTLRVHDWRFGRQGSGMGGPFYEYLEVIKGS